MILNRFFKKQAKRQKKGVHKMKAKNVVAELADGEEYRELVEYWDC